MVYYRKYRPQTISELDLDDVREKLASILSSKELPHAFLFTGSKGLGKTSAARILAKAINCMNRGKSIEPCNNCDACISITNGSNIDVLEIDAASNGGVEEIRTLRERVKFASSGLLKKIYIIDEVHMLSTGAFNALLKTLEEPPPHVVFVLATTELHKLPATVVSRAFQIQFEKPTVEQIVHSLKRVVKGEGLKIEDGVLEKLAVVSDNAFRDAAKNLEELSLVSNGGKLTAELFDKTFKTSGVDAAVEKLLVALSLRNAKEGLKIISELNDSGVDFKIVLSRIVDHLRGLLMMRNGIDSSEKDVKGLEIPEIKELLELSNEAYSELKMTIIPSLPLELMTVKFCILDREDNVNFEKKQVEKIDQDNLKLKDEKGKQKAEVGRAESESVKKVSLLAELINELNKTNKPGAALLRSAKEAVLAGDSFAILTPFPIHAERLKSDNVLPDLRSAADTVSGKKVDVTISILKN